MSEVADHYESLLAEHYTWMFGTPFDDLVAGQRDVLDARGAHPHGDARMALDLGCGSGIHSFALARLGHDPVIGVDVSPTLLAELAERAATVPTVRGVHADLCAGLGAHAAPGTVRTAVCMGDTLLHLPDTAGVLRLFADVFEILAPGGRFVLSFRDLTVPLRGLDRFLPVHGDQDRIMTCFLEDEGPDAVRVHDLVHRRTADGGWLLDKSSYRKLRLDPAWVAARLTEAGFTTEDPAPTPGGMYVLTARRP